MACVFIHWTHTHTYPCLCIDWRQVLLFNYWMFVNLLCCKNDQILTQTPVGSMPIATSTAVGHFIDGICTNQVYVLETKQCPTNCAYRVAFKMLLTWLYSQRISHAHRTEKLIQWLLQFWSQQKPCSVRPMSKQSANYPMLIVKRAVLYRPDALTKVEFFLRWALDECNSFGQSEHR